MLDESLLPFAFVCLSSFFTLANPLGTMPVFLAMTKGLSDQQRNKIVWRSSVIAFLILVSFTICGQVLFTLFGISTNGFRIAAGIIILKIGFDMLQAQYRHSDLSEDEVANYANDISITPLAIPMLCGPGAIANGIMLMDQANSPGMIITLFASIFAIYVITYIILRTSSRLLPILGETGTNVMMRLMGLILMVIAVECFVSGIKPILIDIIAAGNA
jgi:membrane protein, marC family